jgi:filamentous hemagglutinin
MSAANLDLNVQTLAQIGGALQKLNSDGTVDQAGTAALIAQLQQQLGGDFTQSSVSDQLHTDFIKKGGGLPLIATIIIAIALSVITSGAAGAMLAGMQAEAAASAFETLAMGGSFADAAAAGGIMMSSTFAVGGIANVAIAGAVGAMTSSAVMQVGLTGSLNLGQVALSGIAGAITGGIAGEFGSTYDIGRLAATTTAGCVDGELLGSGCESGAIAGFAVGAIQWAGNAMRVDQIASSERFPGITDSSSGDVVTNASGPSEGVDGDQFKLAGTRISVDDLEKYGDVTENSDGTMTFSSDVINPDTLKPWTLSQALVKVGGLTGGNQGLAGTVAGLEYAPGGFMDKLMESFAGPHDFLGSLTAYDSVGNLDRMTAIEHQMFEVQTDFDIPIASIFAIPTLLNQYGLNVGNLIDQAKQGAAK